VTDGVLSATNGLPTGAQASARYSGTVLTFTDTATVTSSSFSVSINWGDGYSSAGTVTGSSTYTVTGTHVYASNGTYTVTTTITDKWGGATTGTGSLIISQNTGVT